MDIKHLDGTVIYTSDKGTLKETIKKALQASVDLSSVNLSSADLSSVNLRSVNLRDTDLRSANLRYASLRSADLRYASLRSADLSSADLSSADLRDTDLRSADLSSADLSSANLCGADLSSADLSALDAARLLSCPQTGAFTAWKKCEGGVIVELLIPAEARRSSATGRKCRAERAQVVNVFGAGVGYSMHATGVAYRKGETVECDQWDDNRWQECSGGIHFFITREEAEAF